jgi:hypothetical protein
MPRFLCETWENQRELAKAHPQRHGRPHPWQFHGACPERSRRVGRSEPSLARSRKLGTTKRKAEPVPALSFAEMRRMTKKKAKQGQPGPTSTFVQPYMVAFETWFTWLRTT